MHQFEKFCLWPSGSKLFDHTVTDTGASVNRNAGRLINYQQTSIFKQYLEFRARHHRSGFLSNPNRRNTDHIAFFQPIGLVDPSLVDPDFTRPQDPVNMTLRNAFANAY